MTEEPKRYARGHHPNSRAQLRPRQTGSRKPTRQKYRRLLIDEMRRNSWQGSTDTEDFNLFVSAKYDYEFEKRSGAERSRLRKDIMELSDRIGYSARSMARATGTAFRGTGHRQIPPDHLPGVLLILSQTGMAGPEMAQTATQVLRDKEEENE